MSESEGEDPLQYIHKLTHRIANILKALGSPGECRSCGEDIVWMKVNALKGGKNIPYDKTGVPHFASCPDAESWRKKKGAKGVEQRR